MTFLSRGIMGTGVGVWGGHQLVLDVLLPGGNFGVRFNNSGGHILLSRRVSRFTLTGIVIIYVPRNFSRVLGVVSRRDSRHFPGALIFDIRNNVESRTLEGRENF